jgi:DNA (cytosine-5)-methyltransferase 1
MSQLSTAHKFPYNWTLKDAVFTKDKGKVFSCFACGGGSTMGYKLAGFDVIGCNEIDPKMNACYVANHNPKFNYLEPIQKFKLRNDLPKELYNLDILDGSPPCSSFSVAGNREDDWGKEKKFREGQTKQILDTLFFDFIDLSEKLQPKIVIAENVKGLLMGEAKDYVRKIYKSYDKAGYYCQHFLLDASKMGVPQKRERVFFIGLRKDLAAPFLKIIDMFNTQPYLEIDVNEPEICYDIVEHKGDNQHKFSELYKSLWDKRIDTDIKFSCINGRVRDKPNTGFGTMFVKPGNVCGTLTTKKECYANFVEGRYLSDAEKKLIGSYPVDYNFLNVDPGYLIGMSVPPVMTAQIATRIYEQWICHINQKNLLVA